MHLFEELDSVLWQRSKKAYCMLGSHLLWANWAAIDAQLEAEPQSEKVRRRAKVREEHAVSANFVDFGAGRPR